MFLRDRRSIDFERFVEETGYRLRLELNNLRLPLRRSPFHLMSHPIPDPSIPPRKSRPVQMNRSLASSRNRLGRMNRNLVPWRTLPDWMNRSLAPLNRPGCQKFVLTETDL
jgi:hypothetical protein